MGTYRILWTHEDAVNSGWYSDVTAPDAASAAWSLAAAVRTGNSGQPPVLVSVTELDAPVPNSDLAQPGARSDGG